MKYLALIFPCLILTGFIGGMVWVWICLIRGALQRGKDREAVRQRAREAREKILADGKVEGPKGKFVWKNWSRKWVDYSNSIPAPKAQSRHFMKTKEMPRQPTRRDDD